MVANASIAVHTFYIYDKEPAGAVFPSQTDAISKCGKHAQRSSKIYSNLYLNLITA